MGKSRYKRKKIRAIENAIQKSTHTIGKQSVLLHVALIASNGPGIEGNTEPPRTIHIRLGKSPILCYTEYIENSSKKSSPNFYALFLVPC